MDDAEDDYYESLSALRNAVKPEWLQTPDGSSAGDPPADFVPFSSGNRVRDVASSPPSAATERQGNDSKNHTSFGIVRSLRSLFHRVSSHDNSSDVEIGLDDDDDDQGDSVNARARADSPRQPIVDRVLAPAGSVIARTKSMLSISSMSRGSSANPLGFAPEMPAQVNGSTPQRFLSARSSTMFDAAFDDNANHGDEGHAENGGGEFRGFGVGMTISERAFGDIEASAHEVDANFHTAKASIDHFIAYLETATPTDARAEASSSNAVNAAGGGPVYAGLEMALHLFPIVVSIKTSFANSLRLLSRVSKSVMRTMHALESEMSPHDFQYLNELGMQAASDMLPSGEEVEGSDAGAELRRLRIEVNEGQEQLRNAQRHIADLTRENSTREAILQNYRQQAEEDGKWNRQISAPNRETLENHILTPAKGSSIESGSNEDSARKAQSWLSMPRPQHVTMSVGDMMEKIFALWHDLSIPLIHRSLFYGSPSIAKGVMYEDTSNIERELRRLEWIHERTRSSRSVSLPSSSSAKSRKSSSNFLNGLIEERAWLKLQLSRMKRDERQTLYNNWGVIATDDENPSRRVHRKEELVRMLWNVRGRERQSAGLVLYLYTEVARTMPLLNPRTIMLESFYATAM